MIVYWASLFLYLFKVLDGFRIIYWTALVCFYILKRRGFLLFFLHTPGIWLVGTLISPKWSWLSVSIAEQRMFTMILLFLYLLFTFCLSYQVNCLIGSLFIELIKQIWWDLCLSLLCNNWIWLSLFDWWHFLSLIFKKIAIWKILLLIFNRRRLITVWVIFKLFLFFNNLLVFVKCQYLVWLYPIFFLPLLGRVCCIDATIVLVEHFFFTFLSFCFYFWSFLLLMLMVRLLDRNFRMMIFKKLELSFDVFRSDLFNLFYDFSSFQISVKL